MRLALTLALALGACAGAEAASQHDAAAPFAPPLAAAVGLVPGESMSYEIKLGGVTAGDAAIAVGQVGDWQGHHAVVVKSRAATAGAIDLVKHVVDEATTWIDLDSGKPLRLETYVELDGKQATATATFSDHVADITTRREGEDAKTQHVRYRAATVYDTHSAMAQIRGWHGARGETRSVFVVGGKRLWRIEMTYVGDEVIGSGTGNRPAIRLDGASYRARADGTPEGAKATRTFSVWLSDDADRVPLRVVGHTELGEVAMELTEYTRPH
jgi:hypothetical protein